MNNTFMIKLVCIQLTILVKWSIIYWSGVAYEVVITTITEII